MEVGKIDFRMSGIGSMSFGSKFDGFGVRCGLCGAENASNQLSGDMPPGIPGYYCDPCKKIKCKEASEFYKRQFEKKTKSINSTVLFREGGNWSTKEVDCLTGHFEEGVWQSEKHPEYLILVGKHHPKEFVSKVLGETAVCVVIHATGMDQLPFLPF